MTPETKEVYKVLTPVQVGDLSYEEGKLYELSAEQVAEFPEGSVAIADQSDKDSVIPTPDADVAKSEEAVVPGTDAPKAPEWAGNHKVPN